MNHLNLILITIDCLRADHVGFLGYERPTTPSLDQIARSSLVFENAIVAGLPTYYSFPALMAGRYPLALGRDAIGLAPNEPTLAGALRDAGYTTAAFVAGNPYVARWSGYDQGFQTFEDFLNPSATSGDEARVIPARNGKGGPISGKRMAVNRSLRELLCRVPGGRALYNELYFRYGVRARSKPYRNGNWEAWRRFPSAQTLTDRALTWINQQARQPFFLWLHYMDAHRPYLPPADALRAIGRSDLDSMRAFELYNAWIRADLSNARRTRYLEDSIALYDASIRAVDDQVGRLVRTLATQGRLDSSLLAITSDHGEAFLEHDEHDHDPMLVHQELARVPLWLCLPALTPGRVRSPFSLLDLPSTLLDLLNVHYPSTFQGASRAGAIRGDGTWDGYVITEVVYGRTKDNVAEGRAAIPGLRLLGVQNERWKLIINFALNQFALFDLQADPRETRPLALEENRVDSRRLLGAVREHLRRHSARSYSQPQLLMRLNILREQLDRRAVKRNPID